MAAPASLGEYVIVLTVRIELRCLARHWNARRCLPVLRVKVERVRGKSWNVLVIDVRIERVNRLRALVGDGKARRFLVRHHKIAVQGLAGRARQIRRFVDNILPKVQSEEIADGRFHAWLVVAVPISTDRKSTRLNS